MADQRKDSDEPPELDAEGRRTDGHWLSYSDYINVDGVLGLQRIPRELPKGRAPAEWPAWPEVDAAEGGRRTWRPGDAWPATWPHDEHLFIVTHQAFELWFKQILLDLDEVMAEAIEVGEREGAGLSRADLSPPAEYRTLTSASLRLFPRLERAERGLSPDERRWLLEMPLPGYARTPSRAWRVAWVGDARLARWQARLHRAAKTLRHATGAYEILATMPPHAFLEFRGRLVPASGFGSVQFREIEILVGLGSARGSMARPPSGERLAGLSSVEAPSAKTPRGDADLALARHLPAHELQRIDRRMRSPSLRDLVAAILDSRELCAEDEASFRERVDEVASTNVAALHLEYQRERLHPQGNLGAQMSNRWQEVGRLLAPPEHVALCWLYRRPEAYPGLVSFLDACFEWDQEIARWRHEHVTFVERMIGARPGTGGGGVEYLRRTLDLPRAFPWLRDFRTVLMAPPPGA